MNEYEKILQYPQIAILMEDLSKNQFEGKFTIPILMPYLSKGKPTNEQKSGKNFNTVTGIAANTSYNVSNYLTLHIPKYLIENEFFEKYNEVTETRGYITDNGIVICNKITTKKIDPIICKKGSEFIIVFVNGDLDKIKIIGISKLVK